jgi:hypothetical protein
MEFALDGVSDGPMAMVGGLLRASRAIDGEATTAWSSRGDGDDAFITVELPVAVFVSGVSGR